MEKRPANLEPQEPALTSETTIRFHAEEPEEAREAVSSRVFYRTPDGALRAGYWTALAGTDIPLTNHVSEFCTLLDGVVRLTGANGYSEIYRQGDSFVIPAGFNGLWETLETCRKFFVIHEHASS
jgi:uncharacterized cupin superfamily protein